MSDKLKKSLEQIDALADEMLAKSTEAENKDNSEDISKSQTSEVDENQDSDNKELEKGMKPDEISEEDDLPIDEVHEHWAIRQIQWANESLV